MSSSPSATVGITAAGLGEVYPFVKATGVYTCPDDSTSPGNNPSYPVEQSYYFNRDLEGAALSVFSSSSNTVVLFEGSGQNMNPATQGENNSESTLGRRLQWLSRWRLVQLGRDVHRATGQSGARLQRPQRPERPDGPAQ